MLVSSIYQICLEIFSLAVDKRTKNNLYMHLVYQSSLCFDRTDELMVW